MLGNVYVWRKQHDKAVELYERALTLNPNYAREKKGLQCG
ncbi:MAG: hypothetical protein CVU57_26545 [Deltaproteobacteria bacterium HGW-Deltaproteobacteria-15]|nr:MAG: hypothetical protein CVU57_26545 [Deltaproteobacteria bacterium HGW-Deltaproteobacteria-15]